MIKVKRLKWWIPLYVAYSVMLARMLWCCELCLNRHGFINYSITVLISVSFPSSCRYVMIVINDSFLLGLFEKDPPHLLQSVASLAGWILRAPLQYTLQSVSLQSHRCIQMLFTSCRNPLWLFPIDHIQSNSCLRMIYYSKAVKVKTTDPIFYSWDYLVFTSLMISFIFDSTVARPFKRS